MKPPKKLKTILETTVAMLVSIGILAFPAFAEVEQKVDLRWRGCGITKKAFMAEAAQAYKKKTGKVISLKGGGATLGIRTAAAGDADIGGACRPAKPELSDMEKGVRMTHVGWDAVVAMVHPDNPVDNLTREQLFKIMKGEIRNWSEVGGTNDPIAVVVRRGRINGVGYMARRMLFNDSKASFYRRAINLKSSAPVEQKVEKRKDAIGLSGVSSARRRKVKLVALDGVAPTKANVASGSYPFFRPLYLVTKGEPRGEVKSFLDWLLSPEGQQLVSEQHTVNLKEGESLVSKFKHWENTELIMNYQN
ncbi:Phosphate ABC transporter, periplasmic phosphate-binding protein PstS (TC 3.A.1.7.1) [Olavius sp. associated proteobacterium Delta 1]|nr:Phosphate ABC transporter, periplasmic phosphate-binding protein PstS (TC 3.A.1.7.1) [Olavius sp. associated proteobacterium Delta 1]